jgi:RimJ/RimL family protein N-acetyltransferase
MTVAGATVARCASNETVAVRLADGTAYRIRSIRPEDKDLLVAGLASLSAETRYKRFLSPKPRLTRGELRYLTEVDFADHHAVLAVTWEEPERLVGVGRWVRRADDPATAEVAVVVGDAVQGQGAGQSIGLALADAAADRGITRFVAEILPSNVPAHRLLAAINERIGALQPA